MLTGELDDTGAGGGLVGAPLAGADHQVRADRQPEGGEDPLHVLLVLSDGGGEDTRADVRDAGQFQETLEGAVLAVGAVQDGEDHVDVAEGLRHRAGLAVEDLAVAGGDGEDDGALAGLGERVDVGDGALGDRHPRGLVGGEHPAALGGDADGQDVVPGAVDGAQDGAAGDHGDAVLGAAPAEDDGDARLAGFGSGLGEGRVLGEFSLLISRRAYLLVGRSSAPEGPCRARAPDRRTARRAPRGAAYGVRRQVGSGASGPVSGARAWRCGSSVP